MFQNRSKKKTKSTVRNSTSAPQVPDQPSPVPTPNNQTGPVDAAPVQLTFHCQLAHGSPTGIINGFSNLKELYLKIAECYDIDASEILFCTLNTHKIDVTKLLGGQLSLDDFIFAHIHGQPKLVELEKLGDALGLTITDNGAGKAFIKGIQADSLMGAIKGIFVGDHIEKINDQSVIGLRHHEVAKILKNIPSGETFSLRLVEPQKSAFAEISVKSGVKKSNIGTGKETLRLRAKGSASVGMSDLHSNYATEKINALLESFLGISDAELAQSIWEVGSELNNPSTFAEAMKRSDLCEFGFTDSFVFDLWGAISDVKIKKIQEISEKF